MVKAVFCFLEASLTISKRMTEQTVVQRGTSMIIRRYLTFVGLSLIHPRYVQYFSNF